MYVKIIVCGKGIMGKMIDIKGRGKMGIRKIPKCSVKMIIEEKPLDEWYKLMVKGKCPRGTASVLKTMAV